MGKERFKISLINRGVGKEALNQVESFCAENKEFIFPKSQTVEEGFELIMGKLDKLLTREELDLIKDKTIEQLQLYPPEIIYGEEGYDSSQANRETGKIVSQLICIGGVFNEAKLLGLKLAVDDLKGLLKSEVDLTGEELELLEQVAEKVAGEQDFLFPGVTVSSDEVEDLETMALATLAGKPSVSVRSITGVGGLRFDQEWNYLTDFNTFAELKVEEDKRFYPGLGVYYLLSKFDWQEIPVFNNLAEVNNTAFVKIKNFVEQLKVNKVSKEDFSLLCTAFIPRFKELKRASEAGLLQDKNISNFIANMISNFHSPSHEFGHWLKLGKILSKVMQGEFDKVGFWRHFEGAKEWSKGLWSFNSPIHLPWTTGLAYLSNDLIGKITNKKGDSVIRFGLGSQVSGKSMEIRIYYLQNSKVAIRKMIYNGDLFEFSSIIDDEWIFDNNHEIIQTVNKKGFLQAAVDELEKL